MLFRKIVMLVILLKKEMSDLIYYIVWKSVNNWFIIGICSSCYFVLLQFIGQSTHNKWLYIEFQIEIEIYNNSFRVYGLSLEYGNAYFAAYVERFCCVIASMSYKESKSHYYTICVMLLRRLSHSSYCMLIYK